jgi:hypothetical protein
MRRLTFIVPGKALARLIQEPNGLVFFDYMSVLRKHRKNGICTEFIRFTAAYCGRWPELDIRYQSKVAQRVATYLGYRKIGRSERYRGCALWAIGKKDKNPQLPSTRMEVRARRLFRKKDDTTEVLYLQINS